MTVNCNKWSIFVFLTIVGGLAATSSPPAFAQLNPQDRNLLIEIEDLRDEQVGGVFSDQLYFAFHNGDFDLFDAGTRAPDGLAWLASEGFIDQLVAELRPTADSPNRLYQLFPSVPSWNAANPVVNFSQAATVIPADNQFVSVFGRVYPSDDAFFGNDDPQRHRLYDEDGNFAGPVLIELYGSDILDAGTRANDEQDLIWLDRGPDERGDPSVRTEDLLVRPHPGFKGSVRNPDAGPVRLLADDSGYCLPDDVSCLSYTPDQLDFTQPGFPIARIRISEYFHGGYSGSFFDPERSGEGFSFSFIDTDPRQIVFYWYTYADDGSGEQRWFIGQGNVPSFNDPLPRAEIFSTSGGRLSALTNPDSVELEYWGSAFVGFPERFPGCDVVGLVEFEIESEETMLLLPGATASGPAYRLVRLGPQLTAAADLCGPFTFSLVQPFP